MKRQIAIIHQTLIISTGILFLMGAEGFIYFLQGNGDAFHMSWYDPFAIILTGFLCSLAIRILPYEQDVSKKKWALCIAAHFLINLIIVSLMGYLAEWYVNRPGYFLILIYYIITYLLVWTGMLLFDRYEERLINRALQQMHDEE